MALTAQVVDVDISRRKRTIKYKLTPTGNYTAGGDTVDLTAATNPNSLPMAYPSSSGLPARQDVRFPQDFNGCAMEWVAGADIKTGKVKIFTTSDTEHAGGAYSADELAAFIFMEVTIPIGK